VHLGKEWDSDCSSSDSEDEGLAASAFNKSSLFPNKRHTCLMAKEKKVSVRYTPKYTTSSDNDSSDDEVDYTNLFKGLDRAKVDKINELIDALNEKDRLLEKQEDILYEEHDKFVSVQKSLALEIKRNEMLSSELSACHEIVSSLKSLNDDLNAKLEEANKSSSCVEHVNICNRCKDFDVNACNEHLIAITKLNEDGLGFQKETKNLTSQKAPILNKEKGKAPMASSYQKCHAYIYDRKYYRNAHRSYDHNAFDSHAMFAVGAKAKAPPFARSLHCSS
jgi:predicted transcriptional regulator